MLDFLSRILYIMFNAEISLRIKKDMDVVTMRQKAIWFARQGGFSGSWPTLYSTIISGLAREILVNGAGGWIFLDSIRRGMKYGIAITAVKRDIEKPIRVPLHKSYFSKENKVDFGSLIFNKLIDELNINPNSGDDSTVRIIKWIN